MTLVTTYLAHCSSLQKQFQQVENSNLPCLKQYTMSGGVGTNMSEVTSLCDDTDNTVLALNYWEEEQAQKERDRLFLLQRFHWQAWDTENTVQSSSSLNPANW